MGAHARIHATAWVAVAAALCDSRCDDDDARDDDDA